MILQNLLSEVLEFKTPHLLAVIFPSPVRPEVMKARFQKTTSHAQDRILSDAAYQLIPAVSGATIDWSDDASFTWRDARSLERLYVVLSGDPAGRLRVGSLWAAAIGNAESHVDSSVSIGVRLSVFADDSDRKLAGAGRFQSDWMAAGATNAMCWTAVLCDQQQRTVAAKMVQCFER